MRVYVAVNLNGSTQYYQRDREAKNKDGHWFAQPYFVIDRLTATQMDDVVGKTLVMRLRNEFKESAWLESVETRERIDVLRDGYQESGEDTRTPMIVSFLDDGVWHIVRPCLRPAGRQWYVKVRLPNREQETLYADTIDELSAKIIGLKWTPFLLDKYEMPPAPTPAQPQRNLPRLRPGSI